MDLILVGPGRAGTSVSLCLVEAGHDVVGVVARRPQAAEEAAALLHSVPIAWESDLPDADLALVAVRDDAISSVASVLADHAGGVDAFAHLSGAIPVDALAALDAPLASFHPLQTLPNPQTGAARLPGSWVGITSDDDLFADRLFALAASAGMRPFELLDVAKPAYHAAAAAAANFPLAALDMAFRLFDSAGVPPEAARPLVAAVVDNAFEMGPFQALTGPVARGDIGTVRTHLHAVKTRAPELYESFAASVRSVALLAGTGEEIEEAFE